MVFYRLLLLSLNHSTGIRYASQVIGQIKTFEFALCLWAMLEICPAKRPIVLGSVLQSLHEGKIDTWLSSFRRYGYGTTALSSFPVYLISRSALSSLLSYFGLAMQAFVILQIIKRVQVKWARRSFTRNNDRAWGGLFVLLPWWSLSGNRFNLFGSISVWWKWGYWTVPGVCWILA